MHFSLFIPAITHTFLKLLCKGSIKFFAIYFSPILPAKFTLSRRLKLYFKERLIIQGNESVSELKEFIEEELNGRESSIHWEYRRFNGKADTLFRWHTTDLPVNRNRFYFLTPDKQLVEKTVNRTKTPFCFRYCEKHDSSGSNWSGPFWLSKQETNFSVIRIERKFNNDTIARVWTIFVVNCSDKNENSR